MSLRLWAVVIAAVGCFPLWFRLLLMVILLRETLVLARQVRVGWLVISVLDRQDEEAYPKDTASMGVDTFHTASSYKACNLNTDLASKVFYIISLS